MSSQATPSPTRAYEPPRLVLHGHVSDLTQSHAMELGYHALHLTTAFAMSAVGPTSTPQAPSNAPQHLTDVLPGGGAPSGTASNAVPPTGTNTGVPNVTPLGTPSVSPDTVSATPTGTTTIALPSGSGGSGSAGTTAAADPVSGKLPFTGLAVAWMAAAGAGLAAAGGLWRNRLGRGSRGLS